MKQIFERSFYFFMPVFLLIAFNYKTILGNTFLMGSVVVASILGFVLYNYLYRFVEELRKTNSVKNKIVYTFFILLIVLSVFGPLFFLYYKVILKILTNILTTY